MPLFSAITYDDEATKAELLQLVKGSQPTKTYKIDAIAHRHGVEVLRLPPYHPDLNPIEMIWAYQKVKRTINYNIQ